MIPLSLTCILSLCWIKRFTIKMDKVLIKRGKIKNPVSFFLERPCENKVIKAGISLGLPEHGRWGKYNLIIIPTDTQQQPGESKS